MVFICLWFFLFAYGFSANLFFAQKLLQSNWNISFFLSKSSIFYFWNLDDFIVEFWEISYRINLTRFPQWVVYFIPSANSNVRPICAASILLWIDFNRTFAWALDQLWSDRCFCVANHKRPIKNQSRWIPVNCRVPIICISKIIDAIATFSGA